MWRGRHMYHFFNNAAKTHSTKGIVFFCCCSSKTEENPSFDLVTSLPQERLEVSLVEKIQKIVITN